MAIVPYTTVDIPHQGRCWAVQWVLESGDSGVPWARPDLPDKPLQVTGTFAAGVVQVEVALHPDAPVYAVAKDANSVPMSGIAAAYLEAVQPGATLVRPVATTVTTVTVVCLGSAARSSGG